MIGSISQAPQAQTASQQGPTIDSPEVIAARLAKAVANGGTYEDPELGGVTLLEIPEPLITQRAFMERQIGYDKDAGRSMNIMEKELGKISAMIAKRRPDIAGSQWDFKLVDGKLKISGLDEDDAKWLEGKLNANDTLVDAARAFITTAVAALETTEQTPAHVDYNYLTRRMETYDFSKVADQLSDKLYFREMFRDADVIFDSKRIQLEDASRGLAGLNVAANRLTVNSPPVERMGAFYPTSYATSPA